MVAVEAVAIIPTAIPCAGIVIKMIIVLYRFIQYLFYFATTLFWNRTLHDTK